PTIATRRGRDISRTLAGDLAIDDDHHRRRSSASDSPRDLGARQLVDQRSAVWARRSERNRVEIDQDAAHLRALERRTGAHRAVAGDARQEHVASRLETLAVPGVAQVAGD